MPDNKQNGMITKIWGPPGWLFLHSVTFGYPDEITTENSYRVKHYQDFFNNLGYVLPCKYCRDSYNEYLDKLPVEYFLKSRKDLSRWLYLIHNKVNDKLGVPDCDIPTFEEVEEKYEQYRAKCKQTTSQERSERLIKGCVIPENGIKKKCLISVVNDIEYFQESDTVNYIMIIGGIILLVLIIIYLKSQYYK